ncbi:MAG: hypothetical protein H7A55_23140 [Verrucomicrobiaceae bacterium]|nr:hypothetical protein [Verrucomicrobiaceae bacterium]
MKLLCLASLSLLLGSVIHAEDLADKVEAFLTPRAQIAAAGEVEPEVAAKILARPDPGTFFLRYAFALKKHAAKLLTPEQTGKLATVLEQHTPDHSRWHDERNTLRCKFNEVMWRYVGAADAEAVALRSELDRWMQLRMKWTAQEHLAQYRFARAVWEVLDAERQQKLIAGEWKTYASQDTGHTRGDATAKIITRALGKVDDKDAFAAATSQWSTERATLHQAVADTENRERCIVFAMDLNSEAMAHRANDAATQAYAALYLAEADAIRRIVHAAYQDPKARCAKAAADAWAEAPKRFADGASDLLRLLSPTP